MIDLTIELRNHSILKVFAEPSIKAELGDFFSFMVPGAKHMPKYKNGMWDGKIKLFNGLTNEIGAGLFPHLITFASDRKYSIDIVPTSYGTPQLAESIEIGRAHV